MPILSPPAHTDIVYVHTYVVEHSHPHATLSRLSLPKSHAASKGLLLGRQITSTLTYLPGGRPSFPMLVRSSALLYPAFPISHPELPRLPTPL
jgi:hypothetical protein